ncbi:MAG: hypothetical protein AAF999_18230 [Pseudomonadota bacterium]
MLELIREFANAWVTWWVAGLLLSFRMIVPARNFLSERSAQWLAHRLTKARSVSVRRRFDVSFKRYVDQTFGARRARLGPCRLWTLRYRKTAAVSMLTFLAIYGVVLLTLDFDQIYRGVDTLRAGFSDPASPNYQPSIAGFAEMLADVDTRILVVSMMIFNGLMLGLVNTVTDYVSFIETRNILARLGRGPFGDIAWVIVDLMLTTLISIGGFVVFWVVTDYFGTLISERPLDVLNTAKDGALLGILALNHALETLGEGKPALTLTDPAMVAMTVSTYATSIWIWVFFLSTLFIRSVVLFGPLLRLVSFLIDVEDHPFRAAWFMFATVWTIGIALYAWV